jgi:hypothetical protein
MVFFLFISNLLYSQSKVALLIGNSAYEKPLKNPINDVEAIRKTLLSIGFKEKNIQILKNVSKERIEKTLFEFNQKSSRADISFIYFSGHGMQSDNKNYLFPTNTKVTKSLDLRGLVELDFFIQSASGARYGIVLVDACRNNPLVSGIQQSSFRGINLKKGLGQIKTPKRAELIIGFATEIDSLANDGIGNNSPYVKALIKNLRLNLDIRNVLGQVGLDVSMATNNEQNPILKSTLGINSVCLTGNCNKINENRKVEREIYTPKIENSNQNYQESISEGSTLIFQKKPSIKKYSWKNAINYCKKLSLNQQWRLPTRNELKRLSKSDIYTFDTEKNWKKWFIQNHKKDSFSKDSIFWSATSYNYNKSGAWFIDFSKGYEDWRHKDSRYFVICIKK